MYGGNGGEGGVGVLLSADYANQNDDVDTIYGGDGDDFIYGGFGNDILSGDAGDDLLVGGEGDDYLFGGSEADELQGGAGVDHMYGQGGSDYLSGYKHDLANPLLLLDDGASDFLYGGDGNDTLAGYGGDKLFGEGEDDIIQIENASTGSTLTGGAGNDDFFVTITSGFQGTDLRIKDSDLNDSLTLNGNKLNGIHVPGIPAYPVYEGRDEFGNYLIRDNFAHTLTIYPAGFSPSNYESNGVIIVEDFENGDMGIKLEYVYNPPSGLTSQDFSISSDHSSFDPVRHWQAGSHHEMALL